ncbi:ABC transporter substrate-binding protein [Actinopolymorpha sp. B17G11]|uniref:ABC transporter substrate-binding protein n=1 Tax=Actinopolymorpha sp. B17G11 TaxID=3160861 RepID=UPI0032E444E9
MSLKMGTALALAAVLTVAACGSGAPDDSADAEMTKDGKVVVDVMSPADPNTNMSKNTVTKFMSGRFKIQFRWQPTTFDAGPAKEKRQIALASGDYPDLFFLIPWVDGFTQAEVQKLGTDGIAVPLEDLIKQHAPNIQKALDTNKTLKEMATAPDGHIYAMPQWADCYHCTYPDKLWINSAWLKKLDMQMPKTTEDLRTVLKAFKTQDPNGNGKADEIPMTTDVQDSSLIAYLMGAFAYDPVGANNGVRSLLALDGDKVVTPVDDPEWREGLKYIHSLYEEGLIDAGSFTQNAEALQAIGNDPKAVLIGSSPVLWPGIFVQLGSEDGRDKQYDAAPPLTGPDGKNYTGLNHPTSTGYTFMLTNKSSEKAQVQAIKMLDYIYTDEGQLMAWAGPEGVSWTKPKQGDIALDEKAEPMYKPMPSEEIPPNTAWGALAQYNNTLRFRNAQVVPKDIYAEAGLERRLFEATKMYEGHEDRSQYFPAAQVWIDPSASSEMATLKTNLDNYVTQGQLAFITGKKNIDTEWDAWVQGLGGVGLERYLELYQQAYDNYQEGAK